MPRPSRFPNDTSDKWFFRALGVIGIILLLMAGYQVLIRYCEKASLQGTSKNSGSANLTGDQVLLFQCFTVSAF
jgi:hypothetical protein